MGIKLFEKVEDRPTPSAVYNARVYISASFAAAAAMMIGYDSAFIGSTIALSSFKDEFGLVNRPAHEISFITANIVSCYQAGCFFGAILGYPAGQFIGRKNGLIAASLVFMLGAGMMLGANGDRGLGLIYGGRVIAGLGIGAASNLSPIYISEISAPAIRGRLVGLYEMGWQIGGIVGFWLPYGVNEHIAPSTKQWIIPFAIQLVPAGMFLAGVAYLRESPRWLLSRGRRQEALANLQWLRMLDANDQYMIEEVEMMDAAITQEAEKNGTSFWGPFRSVFGNSHMLKRFLLGSSLFAFQNGTGINAINYYSPTVFKSIGVTGTSTALLTTGVFGVIKTLATIVWLLFMIDQLGRRFLFIAGAFLGGLMMYGIGIYIAVAKPADNPTSELTSGGIGAMVMFYLWTAFYSPSWNGTPWVWCAEVFPTHVRSLTQAGMAASNWLYNFIIARFTPQMFSSMGFGVYIFFATCMMVSIPYVYFLVPEPKGIPLEQMEELFAPGTKPWNIHAKVVATLGKDVETGTVSGSDVKEDQHTKDY